MFGHDHIGHGESEGERALIYDMEELTDPVIQHCRQMVKTHPGVPLFIIGHSMGGLAALLVSLSPQMPKLAGFYYYRFFARQRPILSGMVLVGPLIKADPSYATPMMKIIASAVSSFFPSYELSEATPELLTSDVVRNNNL